MSQATMQVKSTEN